MKKCLPAFIFFVFSSTLCFGQTEKNGLRIKEFIKVWGFLKYHHPFVASGKIDWDSAFLNNISKLVDAKFSNQLNEDILDMINSLGKIPKIEKKLPDSLFLKNEVDIKWISQSRNFDDSLKEQLQYIYRNSNQGTNRYIKIRYQTADFSGEKRYDSIGFPDVRYRLLFLSRFWNIINYFAPYKYLATDWDGVLEKTIPKIINATDQLSYYTTLQQLSKSLNDGHSNLVTNGAPAWDLFFGNYTPPFYCEILNSVVYVSRIPNDSIAKTLNIKQGDIISKVDGESMSRILANRRKYISASNPAQENHQLGRLILDGRSPKVTLEIKRGKDIRAVTVTRTSTQKRDWRAFYNYTSSDVGYRKINDSILLISAAQIWDGNIDTIKQLIKKSAAVIFDVRNYPVNEAFFGIADPFLSEPKMIDYATIALPQFPGLFQWKPNPNRIGRLNDKAFKGKVIILCDGRTQSQGEYSCMVLQTIPRSITIGRQTAGADGVVTDVPMGNGLTISYSGYGVYYPDKTPTQRVGIKIDIHVKRTPIHIRENKDEILERALEFIQKKK
ncbi:MAG TPA: S41 family peptidase [Flavitalea sp.]|nr:S41 family peptidase [Flavitalea sp.]